MRQLALGCALLLLGGCSAPPPRGEVTGTVRVSGQPLANVLVSYVPDPDAGTTGPRAAGVTDEKGRYQLKSDDREPGVVAGSYRVTIEDMNLYSAPRAPDGMLLRPPPVRFATHYKDALNTTLRKKVEAGTQTIDLELSP